MKLTKAYEDYLEAILILENDKQEVQSIQISKFLNVSKAAVSKIMNELVDHKLIQKENYGSIKLTDEGRNIATETYNKHVVLRDFLKNIGVSEENAEHDCCLIEHFVSDETINKIKEFLSREK